MHTYCPYVHIEEWMFYECFCRSELWLLVMIMFRGEPGSATELKQRNIEGATQDSFRSVQLSNRYRITSV